MAGNVKRRATPASRRMKEWKFRISMKTIIKGNLNVSFTFLINKYNFRKVFWVAALSARIWKLRTGSTKNRISPHLRGIYK